jgi:hypothetical protein
MAKYWVIAAALFLALAGCDIPADSDSGGGDHNGGSNAAAVALENKVEVTGSLEPGKGKRYSFKVYEGNTYAIRWDDAVEGTGNYTCNIKVSAYDNAGGTILSNADNGYDPPHVFTASLTGSVTINVQGYTSTSRGGFAIMYSTDDSEPLPAPSKISAAALSPDTIKILWEAVPGASYYNVYRSNSAGGVYEKITQEPVAGLT